MKKFLKKLKPWHLITFLATIVAFFVIRLVNLNGLPVFVDEAIYVRWAQVMRNEPTLRFLPLQDGKQPLFMWSMIPMFKIFNDPVIAGRLLSVFAGLGSLLGLTTLSYLLFSSIRLSLLTAALYAMVPYTVFFDRLALVDSLLAMLAMWSLVVGYLHVKNPRLDLSLILGGILGAALLTKSPAILFYFWQPVLAIFFFKNLTKGGPTTYPALHNAAKKGPKPSTAGSQILPIFKLFAGWALAFIISQGIYNILRLGPNFHMIGSRNQDYLFSFSEVLKHPLNPLTGNLKSTIFWISSLFTLPLSIMIPFAFIKSKTRRTSILILLISLLPLLAQALIAKVYTPRYLLYAVTPLLILSAQGLLLVAQEIFSRSSRLKYIFIAILLTFTVITSAKYVLTPSKVSMPRRMRHGYLEEWTAGWGQKDLASFLIDLEGKGEKIVVGTEGYFGTLPDGLQIYTEGHPNITVVGVGQPLGSIPETIKNTSPENLTFLVLNKSRNQLKPQDLQRLQLIKTYKKPARPDGTNEELQVYQLVK